MVLFTLWNFHIFWSHTFPSPSSSQILPHSLITQPYILSLKKNTWKLSNLCWLTSPEHGAFIIIFIWTLTHIFIFLRICNSFLNQAEVLVNFLKISRLQSLAPGPAPTPRRCCIHLILGLKIHSTPPLPPLVDALHLPLGNPRPHPMAP